MTKLRVLAISGSASPGSKTALVAEKVLDLFRVRDVAVRHQRLSDLDPGALIRGVTSEPAIAALIDDVAQAQGVVIATPIYKASMSGLLKCALDIMPQFALAGKVVMPVATGGSPAHVLALDYGIRPVLQSMASRHIVQSLFVSEIDMALAGGSLTLSAGMTTALECVAENFLHSLSGDPTCRDLGLLSRSAA
jgi:FMN reductase